MIGVQLHETTQKSRAQSFRSTDNTDLPLLKSDNHICYCSQGLPLLTMGYKTHENRILQLRLHSTWELALQDYSYYSEPKPKEVKASLDEVDPELLRTFERLGVPINEQKRLANVAVDAVFDSVSIHTTFKKELMDHGIIFCSISEAVRDYPDLVKKHLGSVVRTLPIPLCSMCIDLQERVHACSMPPDWLYWTPPGKACVSAKLSQSRYHEAFGFCLNGFEDIKLETQARLMPLEAFSID